MAGIFDVLSRLQQLGQGPQARNPLPLPTQLSESELVSLLRRYGGVAPGTPRQQILQTYQLLGTTTQAEQEMQARLAEQQQRVLEHNQRLQENFAAAQQRNQQAGMGFGLGMAGAGFGQLTRSSPTPGSVISGLGGLLGGIGTAAGFATGNPVLGVAAGALGTFVGALGDSIDKLKEWSGSLTGGALMGQVSPAMAQVEAMQKLRDIVFAQEAGARTAESAQTASDARERFRQENKEKIIGFENFYNNLKADIWDFLTGATTNSTDPHVEEIQKNFRRALPQFPGMNREDYMNRKLQQYGRNNRHQEQ